MYKQWLYYLYITQTPLTHSTVMKFKKNHCTDFNGIWYIIFLLGLNLNGHQERVLKMSSLITANSRKKRNFSVIVNS